jgi:hypothetical protein
VIVLENTVSRFVRVPAGLIRTSVTEPRTVRCERLWSHLTARVGIRVGVVPVDVRVGTAVPVARGCRSGPPLDWRGV